MSAEKATATAPQDEPPEWMDVSFVEAALRGGGEDKNIHVESFTVSRATAPGDNYASIIYRIKTLLSNGAGERSMLVKILPKGDALAAAVKDSGLFHNEGAMLGKYVPEMNALLKEKSSKHFQPFAARCLHHGTTPSPFIVLEDLKPQGFVIADRHRGLGLRHALLALRTLARFHAASAALLTKNPRVPKDLPNFFKTSGRDLWTPFFESAIDMTAKVCRTIPDFDEYISWLEKFKEKGLDEFSEINEPKSEGFNVIIHGDFWTNNMMFKYDENGQPQDFRVVDLQLSHVTSPVLDLLYFLSTSLSNEVSENHERLLLREYHIALTETLDIFRIRGPSFKELMEDMAACGSLSVFGAIAVWPLLRAEDVPDLDSSLKGDSSSSLVAYENEGTRRWFKRVFPKFKQDGWIKL